MVAEFHYGTVTKQCTSDELSSAQSGQTPYQPKADALYPYDTERLVPYCVGQVNQKDVVLYKKQPDYILFIGGGLLVLVILILLIAALKGGGGSPGVEVVR